MDKTRQGRYQTPDKAERWNVPRRTESLEEDVAESFPGNITGKENGDCDVVLLRGELEISL